MHLRRTLIGSACLLTTLAACQDATRPERRPPTPQQIQQLAEDACKRGEFERWMDLEEAYRAMASGAEVADIPIVEDGVVKTFQAVIFGQDHLGVAEFPRSPQPDERELVAWEGDEAERTLVLVVHADSGVVHGPELLTDADSGYFAAATLSEGGVEGDPGLALSVGGTATTPIEGLVGDCVPTGPLMTVHLCDLLRYRISFSIELKAWLDSIPGRLPDRNAPSRRLTMAAQELTGPRFAPIALTVVPPPE